MSRLLTTKKGESKWVVPAMVSEMSEDELDLLPANDERLSLFIYWGDYIPTGLFERAVCILAKQETETAVMNADRKVDSSFSRFLATFFGGDKQYFFQHHPNLNEFEIFVYEEERAQFRVLVNESISSLLQEIEADLLGRKFSPLLLIKSKTETKRGVSVKSCLWNDLVENKGSKLFKNSLTGKATKTEWFKKYLDVKNLKGVVQNQEKTKVSKTFSAYMRRNERQQ